jgi:hypothetical protein
MKKTVLTALVIFVSLFWIGGALAAESSKMDLKVGDQLFVCGCGKDCDCDTMAKKPGKCSCDKPMVQGTVTKVSEGKAMIKTEKEEREFKTVGLYMCACGAGCDCGTISQKPGNCVCGKPMKKVGEK